MAVPCISRLGLALVGLLAVLAPRSVQAQEATEEVSAGVLIGARGVGEVWQDSRVILDVGRSSRFGGAGMLSYRAWRFVSVDFEAAYHRMSGTDHNVNTLDVGTGATSLELVPLVFALGANHRVGSVEVFGAIGSAVTVYNSTDAEGTISGTKIGLSAQGGVRIDTGLVQPSIRRDAIQRVKAVDLELMIGRRQHQLFGVGAGLDLSGWRVGVGLLARM
jgi:hypothetical protein